MFKVLKSKKLLLQCQSTRIKGAYEMDIQYKLCTLVVCSLLAGCNSGGGSDPESASDQILADLINRKGLTATPMSGKTPPASDEPIVVLGKRLFFSKSLSGNRDTACVTCHHPQLGGGDNLSLPIGVDAAVPDLLGPGRVHRSGTPESDGGPTVPRNAPTTFNIAAWNTFLFHDGRVEGQEDGAIRTPDMPIKQGDPLAGKNLVQAQARFPFTSKEEMKGFAHDDKNNQQIREFLAQRLGGYGDGHADDPLPDSGYWLRQFRAGFNQPTASADELITEQNISFAIGEYQRSQVFVTTPWQRYVQGDSQALSDSAKRGALLFLQDTKEGGVGCSTCHSGDFFTDEGFHNIAIPQLGRGKGDGDGSEDFGRFRETGDEQDKFAFRTPSLLNVEMTGPWGHTGAYTSLEGIVKHHLKPQQAISDYDVGQLTQVGTQNLDKLQDNTQAALDHSNFALRNLKYSNQEVSDLVSFLKALTDPCTKDTACLAPWILDSSDDPDPNGDQLEAIISFVFNQ